MFGLGRNKNRSPKGMERATKVYDFAPNIGQALASRGETEGSSSSIPKGSLRGTGAGFAGEYVQLTSGGWYEHKVVVLPGKRDFTTHHVTLVCRDAADILDELRPVPRRGQLAKKEHHRSTLSGTITRWIEGKGFGFIAPDSGGPDVFLHAKQVNEDQRSRLTAGALVTFSVRQGSKGPSAYEVRVIG